MQILMGIAGGAGIFIGYVYYLCILSCRDLGLTHCSILVIALTIVRLVALFRTQFWRNKRFTGMFSTNAFSNFSGVTVQLSFSIIPAGTLPVVVDAQSPRVVGATEGAEQERLIET